VSRRVRITAKRRDEIDIEKLALALLGLVREMERKQQEMHFLLIRKEKNWRTKRRCVDVADLLAQ